ncbi:MAG: cyanophycinase [Gemmatimonas sp.]|uniref:cyanophycinase n=1 Tax=Gemmatimonas sp. TaxID=1962908 RepID=UPI0022BCE518|nr:cyanophycinase [Gemmatimonas sp.]MCE2954515.1 cyanophycinase [Gemmatimonas sp.]MCZ8010386.1 cyanophycinase [Gemmatimonas sp.]MCZ8266949.1 cyanophycinase [Gemmatimonas sp.]
MHRACLKAMHWRLAGVLLLSAACARTPSPPAATPQVSASAPGASTGRGTLFIVGGGTQPLSLVQDFVTRAGGAKARIVVFAMASASGERSGESSAARFRTMGAEARNVWITREQANTDSVARLLDGATAVWFGGGDQNRLTAVLRGTRTERAIRARYEAGAVIGGTSAGAAVLSTPMITGDELGTRRDTSEAWTRVERGSVAVDSGFGYLTTAIVDQHFLRRKRHNRLLSLVLATPPHLGVGIDEGTALIVEPNGQWRVEGASAVLVVDAREAQRTAAAAPVLGAGGARLHLLPAGSTFNPATGRAQLPR